MQSTSKSKSSELAPKGAHSAKPAADAKAPGADAAASKAGLRGLDFDAQSKKLAPPADGGSSGKVVQRKLDFSADTKYLDPSQNAGLAGPGFAAYRDTISQAQSHKREAEVVSGKPASGEAAFKPLSAPPDVITVQDLASGQRTGGNEPFNARVTAMGHETNHALDHWNKIDGKGLLGDEAGPRIHSEWRSFATQTAITKQMLANGTPTSQIAEVERQRADQWGAKSFTKAKKDTPGSMFQTTLSYLARYDATNYGDLNADKCEQFISAHGDWMQEALDLHSSKLAAK